jgi:hypothetical protein
LEAQELRVQAEVLLAMVAPEGQAVTLPSAHISLTEVREVSADLTQAAVITVATVVTILAAAQVVVAEAAAT